MSSACNTPLSASALLPSCLLNPLGVFGQAAKVPGHVMQVWIDSRSFIDLQRIEVYLAAGYTLRN